ncbi:MAG TPA: hypothetical protein VF921_12750 [Vicinamibacterales bacterium]
MAQSWRAGAEQAATIARATLSGFLESDLMPPGMQAPALIWAAAFLVAPSLCLPAVYLVKYPFIRKYHPAMVERALWGDRLLFLLLSAGAMGLISVVLWDTLFPAKRDAYVLTPMPIPLGVQMVGRLSGLVLLFAGFTVALNAIPAIAFPTVSAGAFIEIPRAIAGHIVSALAAGAFVFFSVTSAQGIVILAFGRRAAARLASLPQAGAVLLFLLSLLFLDPVRGFAVDAVQRGDPSAPGVVWFPPAWFLGLYELVAGTPRPLMTALALRAVAAGAIPFAVTVAIYAFGYTRLLARAVEAPPRSTRFALVALGSRIARAIFVRRPEEQAICAFVLRAIARSGRHSMLMSIYVGAGLALMATSIIPAVARFGYEAFATPGVAMLSPPLVMSVALAVGMRILMTIPVDLPARWVFQTTALVPRRIDAAVNKAMLMLVLPPVALLAGISAWILWGPAIAWRHAVFCSSLTLILCEVLLGSFTGSPMTRPYVPGRSRFHMWWAFYLTAFTTYCYTMAGLEVTLLQSGGLLIASGVFVSLAFASWLTRKIKLRHVEEVPFEVEALDEMFQGFNLTETYAAQSVAPTADGSSKFPV